MSMTLDGVNRPVRRAGRKAAWLWLLGALPGGFSVALFVMLALGIEGRMDDAAFPAAFHFSTPLPVLVHAGGGVLFWLLAPLQFFKSLRTRYIRWHRMLGAVLALSALAMGVGAIWLLNTYSGSLHGSGAVHPLKYWGMMALSLSLFATVALGVGSIWRGDRDAHGLWMMRLSAVVYVGMTRIFFEAPLGAFLPDQPGFVTGLSLWMAFAFNLGFVETLRLRHARKATGRAGS